MNCSTALYCDVFWQFLAHVASCAYMCIMSHGCRPSTKSGKVRNTNFCGHKSFIFQASKSSQLRLGRKANRNTAPLTRIHPPAVNRCPSTPVTTCSWSDRWRLTNLTTNQNISTGPNGCEQKESERTEGLAFEATIQQIRFHDTSKPVRNMRKSSVNHPWKTIQGRFQAIHRALKAPSKVWSSSRSCRRSSATRRQLPKLFFSSWQYLSTKPCLKDSHSLWNSMKRYLNQHDYQIWLWYYQLSTLYQPYINICPW